jgi:hypothetical protein
MTTTPPITTFRFNIGECLPHDRSEARYIARLSMALADLRVVGKLLGGDVEDYERMYLVRLMASHMHEALSLIEAPRKKWTALPPLDQFLSRYGEHHTDLQDAVRGAQAEVILRLAQPLVYRLIPVTLRFELNRIRNQFFHYNWEKRDDRKLADAMGAAANLEGEYLTGTGFMRARFADEIAGQMMHPFLRYGFLAEDAARELYRAILELIGPIARFGQAAEALHFHSREHGVVRVEHADGRVQTL